MSHKNHKLSTEKTTEQFLKHMKEALEHCYKKAHSKSIRAGIAKRKARLACKEK